ncbi:MAG: hypothetical protein GF331_07050 [Chitinivibrionales bacterium]|nr:hypothetical protein [Chitinivibrionales bacterium]
MYMRAFQLYDRLDVKASNILCWIGDMPRFGHRLDTYRDIAAPEVRKYRAVRDAMSWDYGYPPLVGEGPTLVHARPVSSTRPPLLSLVNVLRSFTANPVVTYRLSARSRVTLHVYSMTGRLVASTENRLTPAGTHTASWHELMSSNHAASGAYYVTMRAESEEGTFSTREKLFVMRGR